MLWYRHYYNSLSGITIDDPFGVSEKVIVFFNEEIKIEPLVQLIVEV